MKTKKTVLSFRNLAPGILIFCIMLLKFLRNSRKNIKKVKTDCSLYTEWLKKRQKGITPEQYLNKKGYKKIAIYGMGVVGVRLYEELRNSSIEIPYVIDRRPKYIYSELKICNLNDALEEVDAVVVSLQTDYKKICEQLTPHISAPIISVKDIIFDL